jgi:tetratricopeptide (TPR) repeat protein
VNAVQIIQNLCVKLRQLLVQTDDPVSLALAAFFLVRTAAAILALKIFLGSAVFIEKYILRLLADILFDKDRLPAVIEEYNRAVTQAESSVESDRKRLKKSIKSLENEVGNIISVIARTGSESLTAALDGKEKELAELRAQLSGLERRSARVDIDEEQIKRAFDYGRELLLSGKIPRLRQLIELYVERVEILPDSVSVTLNILRGLQANESGAALDRLNRTYPEALKITREADREEVVSASGE